ncbi:hypothetical protein B0H15DRAFT_479547 [Mycena belliarum]|uniref:Uncharacterized protein n=1 Tax=Mycena belliarum TaxID=1033014 RepID=A0AAD6U0R1_9AGAR|nr:hypothetical protein B0H15DRAFT_479547 [Mycena belliae]
MAKQRARRTAGGVGCARWAYIAMRTAESRAGRVGGRRGPGRTYRRGGLVVVNRRRHARVGSEGTRGRGSLLGEGMQPVQVVAESDAQPLFCFLSDAIRDPNLRSWYAFQRGSTTPTFFFNLRPEDAVNQLVCAEKSLHNTCDGRRRGRTKFPGCLSSRFHASHASICRTRMSRYTATRSGRRSRQADTKTSMADSFRALI